MKKCFFWVTLAVLVSVNAQMPGMADPMQKQRPDNTTAAQASQAMTPTEKYNMLGKQTPSDHSFQPAYGASKSADPNAEAEKEAEPGR